MFSGLLGAAESFAGISGNEDAQSAAKAGSKISTVIDQLENADGESDAEKLRTYFSGRSS
jgi:hypothetical protein